MTTRVIKIEVFARRETRCVALLSREGERSVWTISRDVKVLRATVVEMVCDGDCEPTGVVCGRVVTPPALQAANIVTPSKVSSRPREITA